MKYWILRVVALGLSFNVVLYSQGQTLQRPALPRLYMVVEEVQQEGVSYFKADLNLSSLRVGERVVCHANEMKFAVMRMEEKRYSIGDLLRTTALVFEMPVAGLRYEIIHDQAVLESFRLIAQVDTKDPWPSLEQLSYQPMACLEAPLDGIP